MKTKSMQQEILLFGTSTLAQREWCEKDASNKESFFVSHEQLENACWNGLLYEIIPEVMQKKRNFFLWQINSGKFFLSIELGEQPVSIDHIFSIDPYLFKETINNN
jgi:hypothetical protein